MNEVLKSMNLCSTYSGLKDQSWNHGIGESYMIMLAKSKTAYGMKNGYRRYR